jgi:hypothetical protein
VREAQGDTNLPAKGPLLYRVEAELKLLVLRLFVSLIYRPITNPANTRVGSSGCRNMRPRFLPKYFYFLKILATLSVSVATAERSFSTLRRVKSWLRASMAQERLSGLALLNIHKTIDLNVDEIIDIFAKKKKNRIRNLINIFSNVMSKEFANFRH